MHRHLTACLSTTGLVLLVFLNASNQGWTADPGCAVIKEAFRKSYGRPYHQIVDKMDEGKPSRSEMLFDGKDMYMQIHGEWIDAGAMDNPFADVMTADPPEGVTNTCQKLRQEVSDGQQATLYQIVRQEKGDTRNSQVWISAAGLVLRMSDPAEHFELRADYLNIKAPANAKKLGA